MRTVTVFAAAFLVSTGWALPIFDLRSADGSNQKNGLNDAQNLEHASDAKMVHLESENMSSQNGKRDLFDFLNDMSVSSFKVGLPLPRTKVTERDTLEMKNAESVVIVGDSAWEGSMNEHMNECRMVHDYMQTLTEAAQAAMKLDDQA